MEAGVPLGGHALSGQPTGGQPAGGQATGGQATTGGAFTGALDFAPGSHACVYHESANHRSAVLSEFFASGVAQNQKLLYFPAPGTSEELWPGASDLVATGRLVVGDAGQRYFPGGRFSGPVSRADVERSQASALAQGYTGIRAYAECGWVIRKLDNPRHWVDYELWATRVLSGTTIIGLCGFDNSVKGMDALHPQTVGERISPYWVTTTDEGVCLSGEVDRFCVAELRGVLRRALADEPVLDLAGLGFIDSAGVRAVQQAIEGRPHSSLRNVPPTFARIWALLEA